MGHNYHKDYFHQKKTENSENKVEEVVHTLIDDAVTVNPNATVDEEGNMEVTVNVDVESIIEQAETLIETEVEELNEEDVMDVEVTDEGSFAIGVVTGCSKLNVREKAEANSEVLLIINNGDEVTINLDCEGQPEPSDVSFYKVTTASGVEGYCMTKYIEIK